MSKEIDRKELGSNPFVSGDFKVVVRKLLDFEKLKKDDEGDWLPTENIMEQEKFVKIYTSDKRWKKSEDVGIENLNEYGLGLFFWLMFRLKSGEDWVYLDKEDFMKDRGIGSINTFKKALTELLKKNIICAIVGCRGYYWINPKFFFMGSRINAFPKNVVEYKPKEK